ncbi:flagellar biosynthetic protein FliO [Salinibacillus xinjiangensis]|nr:flagellar biosynthetic protein FliO [Salinibacillus xinjiangensis]
MKKHVFMILIILFCFLPFGKVEANMNLNDYLEQNNSNEQKEEKKEEKKTSPTSEQEAENNWESEDQSLLLDIIKMVFMLAIVLALIYFLLKFLQKRNKMFQQTRSLENIGGISLGSNKSVQLLRIGKRVFVVGVGEDISLLTEIDDEDTLNEVIKTDNDTAQTNHPLQAIMKQVDNLKERKGEGKQKQSFKQLFSEELKTLKRERKELVDRTRDRKEDQHE